MRRLLAILRLVAAPARGRAALALLLATLTVLAGIGLLGVSGWFVTATALAGLAGIGISFDVFRPSALIRLLALGRTAARYGERLVSHDATLAALARLRVLAFAALAKRPWHALERLRAGNALGRITADVDALDGLLARLALPLGAALASLALVGTAAALVAPVLALVVLPPLVLLGLVAPLAIALSGMADARRRGLALDAVRVRTIDLVRGQVDLLVAGRADAQVAAIAAADARLQKAAARLERRDLAAGLVAGSAGPLALAGILLVGHDLHDAGLVGAPVLAGLALAAFAAAEAIAPFRRGALEVGRMRLAARRLAPLLEEAPAEAVRTGDDGRIAAGAGRRGAPVLALEGVGFSYPGAAAPVLAGLDLVIAPGEHVALVGPSGEGKSTVLALLAGLASPGVGHARLDGRPVVDVPETERWSILGVLPQRTVLFRGTIAENLRVAAPDADEGVLWRVLETVGLAGTIRARGLDARLGDGGAGLSGGEARRLALARLLLRDTPVLLLDEPTEGLEAGAGVALVARLRDAARGRTVVLVTHRAEEAALADRTVRLGG